MSSRNFDERYSRQVRMTGFGVIAQEKLQKARIAVVGAGGLGCPLLTYLAAAGVGHLTIIDGDVVEASNLNRQTLYNGEDIGRMKAEVAAERLRKQNTSITVSAVTQA